MAATPTGVRTVARCRQRAACSAASRARAGRTASPCRSAGSRWRTATTPSPKTAPTMMRAGVVDERVADREGSELAGGEQRRAGDGERDAATGGSGGPAAPLRPKPTSPTATSSVEHDVKQRDDNEGAAWSTGSATCRRRRRSRAARRSWTSAPARAVPAAPIMNARRERSDGVRVCSGHAGSSCVGSGVVSLYGPSDGPGIGAGAEFRVRASTDGRCAPARLPAGDNVGTISGGEPPASAWLAGVGARSDAGDRTCRRRAVVGFGARLRHGPVRGLYRDPRGGAAP